MRLIAGIIAILVGTAVFGWGVWAILQSKSVTDLRVDAAGSDFLIAYFTAGLLIVAVLQWLTIKRQADIMEGTLSQMMSDSTASAQQFSDQLKVAKDSADAAAKSAEAASVASIAATDQAETMNATLKQMQEDSALQAKQFQQQFKITQTAAHAAERGSYADRAWLFVKFLGMDEPQYRQEPKSPLEHVVVVRFAIENHGRTPAQIDNLELELYTELTPPNTLASGYDFVEMDPDDPKHKRDFRMAGVSHISGMFSTESNYIMGTYKIRRTDLVVAGSNDVRELSVEFSSPQGPLGGIADINARPHGEARYWLHVEVPYRDIYQIERRTCFFARIDENGHYLAEHISHDRHNYWR